METSFLAYYIAATCFGGVFLLVSLLTGTEDAEGDLAAETGFDGGDADFDADFDADLDGDFDADLDGDFGGDPMHGDHLGDLPDAPGSAPTKDFIHGEQIKPAGFGLSWFPILSIRFWTFLLTFGGMTGLLLEWRDAGSAQTIALVSLAMGYAVGTFAVNVLRWARSTDVSSAIGARQMIGLPARVMSPIEPGMIGRVRFRTPSGNEEMPALSADDGQTYARGDMVRIRSIRGNRALISPLEKA